MDNWNDMKLVLAIARAESLSGGATALGINHSTAFRRLNALEEKVGVRLFERLPGGVYQATAAGEQFATTAERVETEAAALSRDLIGRDARLTGSLRVTSSETLAFQVLTAQLAQFRAAHPGIVVELVIDNRVLNLSRREADIAVRVTRPKEPDLHGRKLADIAWTIYGTPELVQAHGPIGVDDQLLGRDFVGWGAEVSGVAAADWLAERAEPGRIVYRSSSLVNQFTAAKAGIGFALLPCYLGDPEAGLVRALEQPAAVLTRELWMVTHADLRKTARVRAFFEIVGEGLAAQQALFAGDVRNKGQKSPVSVGETETAMPDPHRPLKPADKKPGEVPPDIPETEDPERDFAEGQIPGMPVSRDPLLNPGPTPGPVEREPRD